MQRLTAAQAPHVVRYFEHGTLAAAAPAKPLTWIAMEYLGETTLADLIAAAPGRKLDLETALQLAVELAQGLAELHAAGIVHRDFKPENVMVDRAYRLRLIDVGLAKPVTEAGGPSMSVALALVGTPQYIAPEVVLGQALTAKVDVWAFGVICFELLTGRRLFKSTNEVNG